MQQDNKKMGMFYYMQADFKNALQFFNKYFLQYPKDDDIANKLGCTYLHLEKYYEAKNFFEIAIHLNKNNYKPYFNLAKLYFQTGQFDKCIENYNKALQLSPENAQIYYDRSIYYYEKQRYDLAIEDLNKALTYKLDYAKAYNNLAVIYYKHYKDVNKAFELLNKSLMYDKYLNSALFNLGLLYKLDLNNIEKAEYYWLTLVKINPNHALVNYMLAKHYFSLNKKQEAIKFFNKSLTLELPDNIKNEIKAILKKLK